MKEERKSRVLSAQAVRRMLAELVSQLPEQGAFPATVEANPHGLNLSISSGTMNLSINLQNLDALC